jgi:hypothetical protein
LVQHEECHPRNLSIHTNANTNDEPRKSGNKEKRRIQTPTTKLPNFCENGDGRKKIAILTTDADSTQCTERERERERELHTSPNLLLLLLSLPPSFRNQPRSTLRRGRDAESEVFPSTKHSKRGQIARNKNRSGKILSIKSQCGGAFCLQIDQKSQSRHEKRKQIERGPSSALSISLDEHTQTLNLEYLVFFISVKGV